MDKEQDGFLNLNRSVVTLFKLTYMYRITSISVISCALFLSQAFSSKNQKKYILMSALKRISTAFCL